VPVRRSRTEFVDKFIHDVPGASDLRVITPLDAFHDAADPRVKLYWERAHGHWSPAGQRLAGVAMAEAILDWVQSSNRQDGE
ncbi:MAG: hypothetical protein KDA28_03760, partial [Phycisphaerales bacterium]|nr:hypothetical protein [Phycisphaerales bacterium]